ncbi:HpcH/HpaI aldolase/citrate lyase family protein [Parapusillimonas granuli]|uniref:CoA ester lyase n=1 Tax=Parapusillimonas granuli TaxID=380911 RepID=A0A853FVM0_9BURK|nr:CoA ester lyase [Parapusillimonas granuli]MBB5213828.1 (S)-citramalyl-CoA lyase [Parapusillimonas granuli]NYT48663.1 CoA ester lyase [Parapusillimonas granuli]
MKYKSIRAALFVPASRPERFAKALAAGADAVIIDLEDAVETGLKAQARAHVLEFARGNPGAAFMLRVNGADTEWFDADIDLCRQCPALSGVVLPKAESAAQVARAAAAGKPVTPIVESAAGVLALAALAAAPGVERLSFGSLDLMLETGTAPDTAGARLLLDHIRCQILLHSAACGLAAPLDGVHPNFSDLEGLERIATQVAQMGYGGMLCIHPAQVPVIVRAFAPPPDQQAWARRVVAMADETGSFAFQLDGKMVDAPVIERARRILAAAGGQSGNI